MKKVIRLKESDLVKIIKRVISEQPDSKFFGQIEKSGYVQGKPETVQPALQKQEEYLKSIDPDIAVDMLSAAIDGIPGIGNLISAGVDVIHSISYFGRMILSSDSGSKVQNALMGILTLVTTSTAVLGNINNIVAKQGIKNFLKRTPDEIAKMLGISVGLSFKKNLWKYCIVTFLLKFFGGQAASKLTEVKDLINDSGLNIKSEVNDLFDELIDICNNCNPNYAEIDKL
jgi:hypothetical protein